VPHLRVVQGGPDSVPVDPFEDFARTVLVIANRGPSLMVIPESSSLDMELVRAAVADPYAREATDVELRDAFSGYETGTLPPLSVLVRAPMYVDPKIARRRHVTFAAGRRDLCVRMTTRELFGDDPVVIVPLTTHEREPGVALD
jgi:prolyl-tRNA editing enzyme YbaK/EbsC (Cys-tRNA(Pro) deacylase)